MLMISQDKKSRELRCMRRMLVRFMHAASGKSAGNPDTCRSSPNAPFRVKDHAHERHTQSYTEFEGNLLCPSPLGISIELLLSLFTAPMQAATITALDSLQQLDISAPTMNSSTTSSAASSSFSDSPQQPPPQPQRRNRGLSLHIGDMVASTTSQNKRHSSGSTSRSSSPPPCEQRPNELSIEIEGGQQLIIRPNRVVRGTMIAILD